MHHMNVEQKKINIDLFIDLFQKANLEEISTETINWIQQWINNITLKILDDYTAKEAFLKVLQLLVS